MMWSSVYWKLRQGFVGGPQPGASVPLPDTQARLAVWAWAAVARTSASRAAVRQVLVIVPYFAAIGVRAPFTSAPLPLKRLSPKEKIVPPEVSVSAPVVFPEFSERPRAAWAEPPRKAPVSTPFQ